MLTFQDTTQHWRLREIRGAKSNFALLFPGVDNGSGIFRSCHSCLESRLEEKENVEQEFSRHPSLNCSLLIFCLLCFLQMIVGKRAGMEKIIEDMAGHREEVEGDMTWMEEVICLDIGKWSHSSACSSFPLWPYYSAALKFLSRFPVDFRFQKGKGSWFLKSLLHCKEMHFARVKFTHSDRLRLKCLIVMTHSCILFTLAALKELPEPITWNKILKTCENPCWMRKPTAKVWDSSINFTAKVAKPLARKYCDFDDKSLY